MPGLTPSTSANAAGRLLFHRKLFLWAHAVLAFLSICVYLHQVTPSLNTALNFRPIGATRLILFTLPASWPYLTSAGMSWQFVSEQRLGFYLFMAALVVSASLSMALALGAFGLVTDLSSLFVLYICQTAAHWYLSWLLDVEVRSPSNNRSRGP